MSDLKQGKLLGSCRIEGKIASGGMATIYRAHHTLMDRPVAVKVLRTERLQNARVLASFLKEGIAGARLSHPSIARVYYKAEDSGIHYVVMDLIDGRDLKDLLQSGGSFTCRRALEIGRQVAEVLAYAHDRGILHRDIKPANIMLTRAGDVVLTDFGIASLLQDSDGDVGGSLVSGTPSFMAPEQCRGEPLDARADLYSLGATLYTLLTGHPPFGTGPAKETARRVLQERLEPIASERPELPSSACRIVDRLLAKKPDDRYPSARDVVQVLDDAITRGNNTAVGLPHIDREMFWRSSFWLPLAGCVAALWLVVFGLLFFLRSSSPGLADSDPSAEGPREAGTSARGHVGAPRSLDVALEQFRVGVRENRMERVLSLLSPTEREEPSVLGSLVSLFQSMRTVSATSGGHYSILSRSDDDARAVFLFEDTTSNHGVQVTTRWKRDARGRWHLRAEPESGTLSYRVLSGPGEG